MSSPSTEQLNSVPCPECGSRRHHFVHHDGSEAGQRRTFAWCDVCGEKWLYVIDQ
jgi:DNA-directed RNA polymerase subunit M/transcription elongation factor TFIIS